MVPGARSEPKKKELALKSFLASPTRRAFVNQLLRILPTKPRGKQGKAPGLQSRPGPSPPPRCRAGGERCSVLFAPAPAEGSKPPRRASRPQITLLLHSPRICRPLKLRRTRPGPSREPQRRAAVDHSPPPPRHSLLGGAPLGKPWVTLTQIAAARTPSSPVLQWIPPGVPAPLPSITIQPGALGNAGCTSSRHCPTLGWGQGR